MTTVDSLIFGFQQLLDTQILLMCLVGVTFGTFVGALPGIGAIAAVSMLLPLTFYLQPVAALVMLAGIFYGSQYGGSISSILMNIPGTSSSAVVCLDGHPMAKQGRAGIALFVSAIASFIAGSFGIVLMMVAAPYLSTLALSFRAPDYFSAMLFAIVAASTISSSSKTKSLIALMLGLLLGTVGIESTSGTMRFAFGRFEVASGLNLVAVAMGLFGVSEILSNVGRTNHLTVDRRSITLRSMLPTRADIKAIIAPIGRGGIIGAILGALPGTGPTIASFVSYATEKKAARNPSSFGNGAIQGVAGPEAANNAAVQAAFFPTLTLGIPGDAIMAVLLGAMLIHGIVPGPNLITDNPDIFWGLIASFWVGNLFLLILNIPLIGLWVRLLTIPYRVLYPAMLFFVCVGVYSIGSSVFDVMSVAAFGILGIVLNNQGYSPALVLLGFVLGPLIETYFLRSLAISRGDITIFVTEPISAGFLALLLVIIVVPLARRLARSMPIRQTDSRSG